MVHSWYCEYNTQVTLADRRHFLNFFFTFFRLLAINCSSCTMDRINPPNAIVPREVEDDCIRALFHVLSLCDFDGSWLGKKKSMTWWGGDDTYRWKYHWAATADNMNLAIFRTSLIQILLTVACLSRQPLSTYKRIYKRLQTSTRCYSPPILQLPTD